MSRQTGHPTARWEAFLMNERQVTSSGSYSILVVCLGNLCRSPLAERLLRRRPDERPDRGCSGLEHQSMKIAFAG